jgi:hypothetical protein
MQIIPHLAVFDIAKCFPRSFQSYRNRLAAAAGKLTIANRPDLLFIQKRSQIF